MYYLKQANIILSIFGMSGFVLFLFITLIVNHSTFSSYILDFSSWNIAPKQADLSVHLSCFVWENYCRENAWFMLHFLPLDSANQLQKKELFVSRPPPKKKLRNGDITHAKMNNWFSEFDNKTVVLDVIQSSFLR